MYEHWEPSLAYIVLNLSEVPKKNVIAPPFPEWNSTPPVDNKVSHFPAVAAEPSGKFYTFLYAKRAIGAEDATEERMNLG